MYDKKAVVSAIKKYKVIAIIRGVDEGLTDSLLNALYNGGIRLAEFAFDKDEEKTARMILNAVDKFGGKMYIGAGTVTNEKRLELAVKAGAGYIITPVCDTGLAKKLCKKNICCITGALTPTEVKNAHDAGADFVKLFPADAFGAEYIKALLAPLAGVDIIAFGGVNAANLREYIGAGAVAAGVGADLIDKKAIECGKFDVIEEKARNMSETVELLQ